MSGPTSVLVIIVGGTLILGGLVGLALVRVLDWRERRKH